MVSGCIRRAGLCLSSPLFLLCDAMSPVEADFEGRLASTDIDTYFDERLAITASEGCDNQAEPGHYYGEWLAPGDADATYWMSGSQLCSFDFENGDEESVAQIIATVDAHYSETWAGDEPRKVVVGSETDVLLYRTGTDPDHSVRVVAGADYELEFSLADPGAFLLRATVLSASIVGTDGAGAGATISLLDELNQGLALASVRHAASGEQVLKDEAFVELEAGHYVLRIGEESGAGESQEEGSFGVHFDYVMELLACDQTGTDEDDLIQGTPADEIICGLDGDDFIEGGGGADEIYAGAGHDTVTVGSTGSIVYGGDGDDQIDGGDGDDFIWGEGGFDKINGGDGDDVIHGGDQKDVIHGNDGEDGIFGDDGNDVLYGDNDDDYIWGGNNRDTIYGGRGGDHLYGDGANDEIYGETGGDRIEGGQGHDVIDGGPNRDRIIGNNGNDVIEGGPGQDRIRGGPGDDVFDLADGEEDFADGGAGFDDASNSDPIIDTLVNVEVEP